MQVHTIVQDVRDLEAVGRLPDDLPDDFKVRGEAGGSQAPAVWAACSDPHGGTEDEMPAGAFQAAVLAHGACAVRDASASCNMPRAHACFAAQDVEVLVPNAGLALGVAPIHEIDLDDVQAMIDTNGELL